MRGERTRKTTVVVVLAAFLLAGVSWAADDLGRAWELLAGGEKTKAGELAGAIARRTDSKKEKGEALLIRALAEEDGQRAVKELKAFLVEFKGHPLEWRAEMELGFHNYALGLYTQAGRHFERAVALKAPPREGAKARYWLGLALVGGGKAGEAKTIFRSVIADDAGAGLGDAATLALADCLRGEGNYSQALSEYAKFITGRSRSDWVPCALYGAGVCLDNMRRGNEAKGMYGRLVKEFPTSFEAALVRERVKSEASATARKARVDSYVIQIGAFSQEANANKLVERLAGEGVADLELSREERGGRVLYIVHLGEFPTKEAAEQRGKELSTRFGLSCSIVPK